MVAHWAHAPKVVGSTPTFNTQQNDFLGIKKKFILKFNILYNLFKIKIY